MSDAVTIALITAIATSVPLIVAQAIGLIISLRRTDEVKETLKVQTDEVKQKLEATETKTDQKLDHIVVLTNSTLTAANNKITELKETISQMAVQIERLIKEKEQSSQ